MDTLRHIQHIHKKTGKDTIDLFIEGNKIIHPDEVGEHDFSYLGNRETKASSDITSSTEMSDTRWLFGEIGLLLSWVYDDNRYSGRIIELADMIDGEDYLSSIQLGYDLLCLIMYYDNEAVSDIYLSHYGLSSGVRLLRYKYRFTDRVLVLK